MQILKFFIVAVSLIMSLNGCGSSEKIYADHDPAQDFSTYKSFGWLSEKPVVAIGEYQVSPLTMQRIMDAIVTNLEARGYLYTDNVLIADFAVGFSVGARDKAQTYTNSSSLDPWMYRSNWRWGGVYYGNYSTTSVNISTEGTLAIDIFAVARKSPGWHGNAKKRR